MRNFLRITLIIIISIAIGYGIGKFHFSSSKNVSLKQELYLCPMHPTYTSNKQGDCPICGMRLVKKETAMGRDGDTAKKNKEHEHEQVALEINPVKEQYLGIKTTKSVMKNVKKEIKALGIITPDETKLSHIHTKFSGYIEKVFANYEGKLVTTGQPLFTVYSPELVSTQEEYLLALEAKDALKDSKFPEINKSQKTLLEAARRRLELWDITGKQIDKLEKTRKVMRELTIYSPVNGFVTKRDAFEGAQITPTATLYDIADLSTVWALVEVYEADLPFVKLAQAVLVEFPYENIKPIEGKISYIYPEIEPVTRTAKIRVEINNTGFKLKPDMYISSVIKSEIGEHIVVPRSAVIDSGERQIVFVKQSEGQFLPKEVKLGPEVDTERVIYSGLVGDEDIVTDGNFLLDSESNLETALQQMRQHAGHDK